jgi:prepilin-type N-terminal cleavage/methylation domain-containing protein
MRISDQKNVRKGFTFLEIMIVAIILGVIASLALNQYRLLMRKTNCLNLKHFIVYAHAQRAIAVTKSSSWDITTAVANYPLANGTFVSLSSADNPTSSAWIRNNNYRYVCIADFTIAISPTNPSCTPTDAFTPPDFCM